MFKKELRTFFQNKRNELSPEEIQSLSVKIGENLIHNFNFENKTVSFYLPITHKKEIDTLLILNSIQTKNTRIVFPVWNESSNTLEHFTYQPDQELKITNFGIPYHYSLDKIPNDEIDYVITPLLAIDSSGYRVGYGKGVYDHFLANQPKKCTSIGLHFFEIIDAISDISSFDIPLHYCVTPSKVIHFEKQP